jgi:hypothetical protein
MLRPSCLCDCMRKFLVILNTRLKTNTPWNPISIPESS